MPKQKSKCRVRVTKQFEEAAFELIENGEDLKTYPIKKFVRKASTNMASFYRRFSSIEEVVYLFFAKSPLYLAGVVHLDDLTPYTPDTLYI